MPKGSVDRVTTAQRGNRNDRVHRGMKHHRRGRTRRARDCPNGLNMGHVKEDACHDVNEEVATQSSTAQSKKREHDVKRQHHNRHLHKVCHKRHNRIAVRRANGMNHRMIDQLKDNEGRCDRRPTPPYLKHLLATLTYAVCFTRQFLPNRYTHTIKGLSGLSNKTVI